MLEIVKGRSHGWRDFVSRYNPGILILKVLTMPTRHIVVSNDLCF